MNCSIKKHTALFIAVSLASACAMAQQKNDARASTAPASTAPPSADLVIISARGISVTQSEFERAIKTLPEQYQAFAQGAGRRHFADDLLQMKILAARGRKERLDRDPVVIEQLDRVRENLLATAELKKIDKSITISDEDLRKIYEASRNDYEQVTASHILIAFKGSAAAQPGKPELTDDAAKLKAEEIRGKIVAGEDFAAIAKKESDDTGSASRGGDLGTFSRHQMSPAFEATAFAATVGEVAPVVRTQWGYHIIKVMAHTFTPFEEVKSKIEKVEHEKRLQATLDAMKNALNPVFNASYFPPAEAPKKPK
jgi:peptidyl-prolyl cis-trans isomerase C